MITVTYRPKCPNHGCEISPTDNRRQYICPVSGAIFEVAAEEAQKTAVLDKFGRLVKKYEVRLIEGKDG